jgi:hypothetical protein
MSVHSKLMFITFAIACMTDSAVGAEMNETKMDMKPLARLSDNSSRVVGASYRRRSACTVPQAFMACIPVFASDRVLK